MSDKMSIQPQVVLERTLLLEMLASGERVLEGVSSMVDGLRTIATFESPTAAGTLVDAPVEPRVWDVSETALDNYDAEQLVALRADHRADGHDPTGCAVCSVLIRRLGSL